MKITMVMVSSADGRITKGGTSGTSEWASPEDQKVFHDLITSCDCMVMGANTYRTARPFIRPSSDQPRVILTRDPTQFSEDNGEPGLTFTADSPSEIVSGLKARDYQNVLLVGGGAINALFLDSGLVDEIYLTLEPQLFGDGLPLTGPLNETVKLRLVDSKKLNDRGTLLLHYEIVKDK